MAGQLWAFGFNSDQSFMQIINTSSPVQTIAYGTDWSKISCNGSHTASIKKDGTLWLWGENSSGQLGNNSIGKRDSPAQTISLGNTWIQISCGFSSNTAAIKSDGTLWTWGLNSNGQLGDNSRTHRSSPVQVSGSATTWSLVSMGNGACGGIKTDGTLWMWGQNSNGILGDNTNNIRKSSPVQTIAGGTNWSNISLGSNFATAIKTDGTLWTWGRNSNGQLGDNTITNRSSPVQTVTFDINWVSVSCGYAHGAAIKKDGTLWTWGLNSNGQLGDNTRTHRSSPVQVIGSATTWSLVSCSENITAAIKTDGTLWAWGQNSSGQLGDNTQIHRSSPVQTVALGSNWSSTACGPNHIAAIKTDGTLWLCGNGYSGQLGLGNIYKFSPSMVDSQTNWLTVNSAKNSYTKAAIKTDGSLWLWGANNLGQLGNNSTISVMSPVQTISGSYNWRYFSVASGISSNNIFCAAIKTDGTLWTWGINGYGELADGTTTSRSSPVQTVAGGNNWAFIDCGNVHMAAIKTDGTLWMWGKNNTGQLGDNTTTDRSSPIQTVAFGKNWSSASCSSFGAGFVGRPYTIAIKTDGTLWTWGYNSYGQLGDNTVTDRSSPVQEISFGNNWIKASCGRVHSAGVKLDNTLWLWGSNAYGALGDNTTTSKSSPVQTISGGNDWVDVKCDEFYTVATKKDGSIWAWGSNTTGQYDSTGISKSSPVQVVSSATNWYGFEISRNNTFFILENNPNKLTVNVQPQAGVGTNQLIVQPTINISDSNGYTVRTATNVVSVAVQSGNATLSGTTTATAVNGVATFTNLTLTGGGYVVLRFTSSGLTLVDSMSFTIGLFLPIIPKRSEASGKLPTSGQLNIGELAINIDDRKGFIKKSDGTVLNIFNGKVADGGTF